MKQLRKDIPIAIPQTVKDGYVLCPAGGVFNSAFLHCKITRAAVVEGGANRWYSTFRRLSFVTL